ncbi:MAG: macro domain-containing protein [Planctomycetota bacterium]
MTRDTTPHRKPDTSLPQATPDARLERIRLVVGDITKLPDELGVDVIVNAANEELGGGAGVDGAIHDAAGSGLMDYTDVNFPKGCPTGSAVVTPAFGLEARGIRHILHAVGPVWSGLQDTGVPGAPGDDSAKLGYTYEDTMLASCYTRCLQLATQLQARAVAFPAISTGVYGFPKPRAARIALGHVLGHFQQRPAPAYPEAAVFVCFNDEDAVVYREAIETRDAWMFTTRRA